MGLLISSQTEPDGIFGIWEQTEDDSYFEKSLNLYPVETEELNGLKSRRKSEWLCSRYLLHIMSGRELRGACVKDEYGKPYLTDSNFNISISHTAGFTAVMAASANVGIDIQDIVSKIERIAHKFVNEEEYSFIPENSKNEYYHAIWGAKESMYKAYGKRELDFRKNIKVSNFIFEPKGFFFDGSVEKDNFYAKYTLFCRRIENLILVYAMQQ